MNKGFFFAPDFEVFANAMSKDDRHAFFDAIVDYGLHGIDPSFTPGSGLGMAWIAVKMTFDRLKANSEKRAKAGRAGGLMNRKEEFDAESDNDEANESKPKQTEAKEANESKVKQDEASETGEGKDEQSKANESKPKPYTYTYTDTNTNSFLFALDDESPTAPPNEKAKARDNPSGDKAPRIDFDFDKKEWVNITDDWIDLWHKAYPAVDIQAELLRMASWLVSNPTKKKKNYPRAIDFWLSEAQDRGGRKNGRTQYRSVAGAGGLDPSGRPEVIKGADYGQGADIDALFGDDQCATGN